MSWLAQAFADALDVPSLSTETVGTLKAEALLAAQNKVREPTSSRVYVCSIEWSLTALASLLFSPPPLVR